ncbi:MAG: magnesium transporter CorA [Candidatus Poribacteria bacterium]|nr:MAG: magnesium transporter CorA [Candidatus Poribacteria bacterium]
MIRVYRTFQGELKEIEEIGPGVWVHVEDPTAGELEELSHRLNIPHDFLTAALDLDEIPRTEREDDALLVVIRTPIYRGKEDPVPFGTVPLGVILTRSAIVTVSPGESDLIRELTLASWRGHSTAKQKRLLLRLFLRTASRYLQYLRIINKAVEVAEERLEESLRNQDLQALLKYEKSLTYFLTALQPIEVVIDRLDRSGLFREFEEDEELLHDALTEMRQAIEMSRLVSSILHQMMNAFSSMISNNLNVVMRFLTALTVILAIPTMISGIYGMNVALPLQDSPYAFAAVMGVAMGLTLGAWLYFLKRRFL